MFRGTTSDKGTLAGNTQEQKRTNPIWIKEKGQVPNDENKEKAKCNVKEMESCAPCVCGEQVEIGRKTLSRLKGFHRRWNRRVPEKKSTTIT